MDRRRILSRCVYLEVPGNQICRLVGWIIHSCCSFQTACVHHEQRRHAQSEKPLQTKVVRQRQRAQTVRLLSRWSRGAFQWFSTESRCCQPRGQRHSGPWFSAAVSQSQERTAAAVQEKVQKSEKRSCRGRSRGFFPRIRWDGLIQQTQVRLFLSLLMLLVVVETTAAPANFHNKGQCAD